MCKDLIKAFHRYRGYRYTLTNEKVFDISKEEEFRRLDSRRLLISESFQVRD